MSTIQEKALIEAHRDKGSGQFGERHRPEADVTVGTDPVEVVAPASGPAACAARAREALATLGHQDVTESMMLDMLTNLRHLAREEGIDFDDRVDASFEHFQEEMDDYELTKTDRKNA